MSLRVRRVLLVEALLALAAALAVGFLSAVELARLYAASPQNPGIDAAGYLAGLALGVALAGAAVAAVVAVRVGSLAGACCGAVVGWVLAWPLLSVVAKAAGLTDGAALGLANRHPRRRGDDARPGVEGGPRGRGRAGGAGPAAGLSILPWIPS